VILPASLASAPETMQAFDEPRDFQLGGQVGPGGSGLAWRWARVRWCSHRETARTADRLCVLEARMPCVTTIRRRTTYYVGRGFVGDGVARFAEKRDFA
jgi:hypothetical protein